MMGVESRDADSADHSLSDTVIGAVNPLSALDVRAQNTIQEYSLVQLFLGEITCRLHGGRYSPLRLRQRCLHAHIASKR